MNHLSKAVEGFLQYCLETPSPPPPQAACHVREHVQKWIVFCGKVFAFSEEQALTQMICDARWWLSGRQKDLRSLAEFMDRNPGGYDLEHTIRVEILHPAATVALMMLALAGRRLRWWYPQYRFCTAFMDAMASSPWRRAPPPIEVDRETTLKFVRALAPDVMRICLDEGGTIRGKRRARRR
jgi:hypothetical protein